MHPPAPLPALPTLLPLPADAKKKRTELPSRHTRRVSFTAAMMGREEQQDGGGLDDELALAQRRLKVAKTALLEQVGVNVDLDHDCTMLEMRIAMLVQARKALEAHEDLAISEPSTSGSYLASIMSSQASVHSVDSAATADSATSAASAASAATSASTMVSVASSVTSLSDAASIRTVDSTTPLFLSDRQLTSFGELLHWLKYDTPLLARLVRSVTLDEIEPLVKIVMNGVYGDEADRMQDTLLLTVFQVRRFIHLAPFATNSNQSNVKHCLVAEFDDAVDFNSVMRSNSAVTRCMSLYMRRSQSVRYLRKAVGQEMERFMRSGFSAETSLVKIYAQMATADPAFADKYPFEDYSSEEAVAMIPQVQQVARTHARLVFNIADRILDHILRSISTVPFGIRWLCKQVLALARRRFPDASDTEYCSMVGGLFMLRFINPAIVAPTTYGLTNELPTPTQRKLMTQIAKVLQALSNSAMDSPAAAFGASSSTSAPEGGNVSDAPAEHPQQRRNTDVLLNNVKEWVVIQRPRLHTFLLKLTEVDDMPMQMDQDMWLSAGRPTTVKLMSNHLIGLHILIDKYAGAIFRPSHGLSRIITELGVPPPRIKASHGVEQTVVLISGWMPAIDGVASDGSAATTAIAGGAAVCLLDQYAPPPQWAPGVTPPAHSDITFADCVAEFVALLRRVPDVVPAASIALEAWDLTRIGEAALALTADNDSAAATSARDPVAAHSARRAINLLRELERRSPRLVVVAPASSTLTSSAPSSTNPSRTSSPAPASTGAGAVTDSSRSTVILGMLASAVSSALTCVPRRAVTAHRTAAALEAYLVLHQNAYLKLMDRRRAFRLYLGNIRQQASQMDAYEAEATGSDSDIGGPGTVVSAVDWAELTEAEAMGIVHEAYGLADPDERQYREVRLGEDGPVVRVVPVSAEMGGPDGGDDDEDIDAIDPTAKGPGGRRSLGAPRVVRSRDPSVDAMFSSDDGASQDSESVAADYGDDPHHHGQHQGQRHHQQQQQQPHQEHRPPPEGDIPRYEAMLADAEADGTAVVCDIPDTRQAGVVLGVRPVDAGIYLVTLDYIGREMPLAEWEVSFDDMLDRWVIKDGPDMDLEWVTVDADQILRSVREYCM
ncbi:hypothetical protein BC828DRAFT_399056 [Blastocladiella britannica]|nr:hypothetical protein BC828DRAFT_399056 [Blastocladiella britannica]